MIGSPKHIVSKSQETMDIVFSVYQIICVCKVVFLVEAGEGRLFSICSQHLPSALLAVLACNTATVNVRAGQAHKLAYCASDDICLPIYSSSDSLREASTSIRTSLGR